MDNDEKDNSNGQRVSVKSTRTLATWNAHKKNRPKSGPPGVPRSPRGKGYLVPKCGGLLHRSDKEEAQYCKQQAGAGTEHFGTGRCKYHGGNSMVKHGRYSELKHTEIGDLIQQHLEDPDPLNLIPELAAARALFQDFIERYEDYAVALIHWHDSFDAGKLVAKPMQIMDIADAHKLLDTISRVAERIVKTKNANAISLKELVRVMTEMGRVVETYVKDPEVLNKLREGFLGIKVRT